MLQFPVKSQMKGRCFARLLYFDMFILCCNILQFVSAFVELGLVYSVPR